MRLRQLEQFTRALVESQQTAVQIMADHTYRLEGIERRLERVERRLENIESQLEQLQTDMAFVKDILLRRYGAPES